MFSKVNNESVWFGPDQEKKSDWIYNLDNDDIQEIEKVTDKFLLSKIPLKNIKNEYFNLENLKKKYLNKIDDVSLKIGAINHIENLKY